MSQKKGKKISKMITKVKTENKIILLIAIIQLISSLIDLIKKLIE